MSLRFDEYRRFDALGLAQAIRRGDLSSHEVLDAALARLHAINPQVNAVTHLSDAAIDAARRATAVAEAIACAAKLA